MFSEISKRLVLVIDKWKTYQTIDLILMNKLYNVQKKLNFLLSITLNPKV